MINHDPNGNGAYQETTRESIPRAPRQKHGNPSSFMTEEIWPFVGKSFGSVHTTQIPRKTTMGITKNDGFQEGSDMFIRISYIKIFTFFQEKTTLHISGFHTVTFEKRTTSGMLRWSQHTKNHQRFDVKKAGCLNHEARNCFEIHGFCLFDAWRKWKKPYPKWWFNGDWPIWSWQKVRNILKQIQEFMEKLCGIQLKGSRKKHKRKRRKT